MSITFSWKITDLQRNTSDGYVFAVNFSVTANDHIQGYSATIHGIIRLNGELSTEYPKLTEDQCIDWVKSTLGEDAISELYSKLQAELADQITPSTISGVPWPNAS